MFHYELFKNLFYKGDIQLSFTHKFCELRSFPYSACVFYCSLWFPLLYVLLLHADGEHVKRYKNNRNLFCFILESLAQDLERKARQRENTEETGDSPVKSSLSDRSSYYKNSVLYSSATQSNNKNKNSVKFICRSSINNNRRKKNPAVK